MTLLSVIKQPTFAQIRTKPTTLTGYGITDAAKLASPTLTGTPTLPTGTIATTQTAGNSTTALATTAFVTAAVAVVRGTTTVTSIARTFFLS